MTTGNKVSKSELVVKFAELADQAIALNGKIRERRFYPMAQSYNQKLVEFGMYDYKTKKYVLEGIHSPKAMKALGDIRAMLDAAAPKERTPA